MIFVCSSKFRGLPRRLACGFFLIFAVGCVTPSVAPPLNPPIALLPAFQVCHPTEDFGPLQVYKSGRFLGSAEIEWSALEGGMWTVAVLDPIGQRLLSLSCCDKGILAQGTWSDRIPSLGLTKSGQMEIEGHATGVLATEVPCMLSGKFPQPWLADLRRVKVVDETSWDLEFVGDSRTIELRLNQGGGSSFQGSCATFVTSRFFGLKKTRLEWCADQGGTLRGVEGYEIKWSRYE